MCFLALGAPKQETLAARGLDLVPGCGFLSIGAGIDFLAGLQRRAPAWVRAIAMEWFWRMASDPRRLAGRYARGFTILPGLVRQALALRLQDRRDEAEAARALTEHRRDIALAPTHPAE
jgi:UDP-N-acetyl-D-mannosaminuronic acid transferase (WecB/TagA/CpsF family)